jgi:hypothetical protein
MEEGLLPTEENGMTDEGEKPGPRHTAEMLISLEVNIRGSATLELGRLLTVRKMGFKYMVLFKFAYNNNNVRI